MTDNKIAGQTGAKPSRWWLWLLIAAIIAVIAYLIFKPSGDDAGKPGAQSGQSGSASASAGGSGGGGKGGGKRGGGGGIPVVVTATAKSGDIAVRLDGLGAVTPMATVTIKTHVDGQLMKVLFTEGQVVKQGQLIAIVDPRPYQVQLEQAEGTMAHDQALLKNAQVDLERYRTLYKQDSIAEQQLATQDALVRQDEAQIKVDRGAIDSAKLNLVYCNITSPVTGRVGLRQVDPGNIVHASDTNGIVVITQLQPITVVFSMPEDNIPDVMQKVQSGTKLDVDAYDRSLKTKLASGKLLTVDNQIDPSTGTVKLKASFANEDNALFPQQFVNARLLVEIKHNMILIPTSGVQRGSPGTYVYAVNPDNTVSLRLIKVGITEGDTTAITDGVKPGDVVVTEGADKLRDGAKVEVGAPPATGAAGSGAGSGGHGHHNKDGAAASAVASSSPSADSAVAPAASAAPAAASDAASVPAADGGNGNGEHHHHRKDASSSASTSASSN